MNDKIKTALNAPGCERLRDFYEVGPVQRAAVESFVDALSMPITPGALIEAAMSANTAGHMTGTSNWAYFVLRRLGATSAEPIASYGASRDRVGGDVVKKASES